MPLLQPLQPRLDPRMARTKEGYRSQQEGDAGNDRENAPNRSNAEKQESYGVAQPSH